VGVVGRFSQGPNPVTERGAAVHLSGLQRGWDLIAFFYPVTSSSLPASAADVPSEELQRVDSDPTAYMQERAGQLNALASDDWSPDLTVLDALVDSLRFEGVGAETSRHGASWRAGGESRGATLPPKPGAAPWLGVESDQGGGPLHV
jgi:hypothetical protein